MSIVQTVLSFIRSSAVDAMIAFASVLAIAGLLFFWVKVPPRWREGVTVVIFLIGFACGMVGFVTAPMVSAATEEGAVQAAPSSPYAFQRIADALHSTIQLIVLNVDDTRTGGWWLGIARVLLPIATGQLIFFALLGRSHQWWLRLSMQLRRSRTLVLGCGSTGKKLAEFYQRLDSRRPQRSRFGARKTHQIIGIDRDADSEEVTEFKKASFALLQAPFESDETFAMARAERARRIVICSGDDARDRAVASRLIRYCLKHVDVGDLPQIIVSVESSTVARAVRLDATLARAADRIECVNSTLLDARLLLQRYGPHVLKPHQFRVLKVNECHIAIVGSGELVPELAAHAVRSLVYDPSRHIRVTVLVSDALNVERAFHTRFPALTQNQSDYQHKAYGDQLPLVSITFDETTETPIQANALLGAHLLQPIDAIYVVGRNDIETVVLAAEAVKVAEAMPSNRPDVVACLDRPEAMVSMSCVLGTAQPRVPLRVSLHTFRLNTWQFPAPDSTGPDDFDDELARRVWCVYEQKDPKAPQSKLDWNNLPPEQKWWNRCSGDHFAIKHALLGLSGNTREDIERSLLEPDILEWLASLEHRRYVCERLTDGWLWRNGDKLNPLQLNPTIAPFQPLPPGEQAKDVAIVRLLLDQLMEVTQAREDWHDSLQPPRTTFVLSA